MNDDTPETNAAIYPISGVDVVWPDFARKLERERDQYRESSGRMAKQIDAVCLWIEANHPDGLIDSESLPQALDRCREHAEAYAEQQLRKELAATQRELDEAREMNGRMRDQADLRA